MIKQKAIKTAGLSLFFLLSGPALALARASPPEPTEPPSRLSMFADDVTNWLDHIIKDAKHIVTDADHIATDTDHHRVTHSPPLPRPRPAKRASTVASNQQLSEFAPAAVASKKKTRMPAQIRD